MIVLLSLSIRCFQFMHASHTQVLTHPIRSPTKYLFIYYPSVYPFNHPSYQSSVHASSTHSPDNHPSIQVSTHPPTFYLAICLYIHYLFTLPPSYSPFIRLFIRNIYWKSIASNISLFNIFKHSGNVGFYFMKKEYKDSLWQVWVWQSSLSIN